MNIQWTYKDYVTKGPIVQGVLNWDVVDVVINRGNYRDEFPILPVQLRETILTTVATPSVWPYSGFVSVSAPSLPDDNVAVPSSPHSAKYRLPDSVAKIAPKTKTETVKYLRFYNHASTKTPETTVAEVEKSEIVAWYKVG